MIRNIILNGKPISYDLQRKKVKNINLRIRPDKTISVSAAPHVPEQAIEDLIRSRAEFILRALARYDELARCAPPPKQYVDGEVFRVFGQEKTLIVLEGAKNKAEIDGEHMILTVRDTHDTALKKKTADNLLRTVCADMILSVCDAVYTEFRKYGIPRPVIKFRKMVSRWGSCQPARGILTFNYALAESPIPCIEYVVVHEFTHFLHPDHSKLFYKQLAAFMPDWQEHRKLLESSSTLL